ncbi:S8 family serine peptidase [Cellvibrio sp. NN19]|uniref:S8 family serine peptidase n=1 Tax=Cellvibrio chitinivorans TaxID=3102792 RepID=UPI002B412581|nr:S8 family serine peptidase [Cellvibrio sp. NN19]
MRSIYIRLFLLLCLCPAAYAQLPDQIVLDQQLDSITSELDDVIDVVEESVNQEVDAVVDQLEGATREMDAVADSLETELDGVESALQSLDSVDDQLETQLRNQDLLPNTKVDEALTKSIADALALLPDSLSDVLPILDRTGKTVFVEVKVEQDWYAVEHEWLLMLDEQSDVNFTALNAEIIEQQNFTDLGMRLVRFRVPAKMDSIDELKKRLPAHLHDQLDRNHIYIPQTRAAEKPVPHTQIPLSYACDTELKIGMIDTGINTNHPVFWQSNIKTKNFIEYEIDAPTNHGTAVAGLLVGKNDQLTPLLPSATLYAASVFYSRTTQSQGATMMNLVRALNWMAAEKVAIVNMSLSGPDNKILASVMNKLIDSGTAIIAAAGNEGPAASPVYPAAYEKVIAVTAVDDQQRVYRWANQGAYIDFAALGVDVLSAAANGNLAKQSGTSMAAPVVSALFACELAQQIFQKSDVQKYALHQRVFQKLIERSVDLGKQGRDTVFGYGLLQVQSK